MQEIIAQVEALLSTMRAAHGTAFSDIVADGRESLLTMLDRLAEAGAVDDEDEENGLVDLLMAG